MRSHELSVLGFVLVAVAVLAIHLRARAARSGLASVGDLLGRIMASRAGRWGVLLTWWWIGWHFLAR